MVVAGAIFFFQGIGVLKGSTMSNTTTWSVLGPIIAIAGAALVLRGRRGRTDQDHDT